MIDAFIGTVTGSPDLEVLHCYYDQTLNPTESAWAEGRSTAAMQDPATFVGWPFDTIWTMGLGDYFYPIFGVTPAAPERVILIRWCNDGKNQWSDYRKIDLGGVGDTEVIKILRGLGTYRTRQYEIVCTAGLPITIAGLEESVTANDN